MKFQHPMILSKVSQQCRTKTVRPDAQCLECEFVVPADKLDKICIARYCKVGFPLE